MVFYNNFINICEEKGISPTRVLTSLNISRGSLGRWKDGGEPRNEYKKSIADFLGVSVSELTSGEIKEKPAAPRDDEPTALQREIMENIMMLNEDYQKIALEQIKAFPKAQG